MASRDDLRPRGTVEVRCGKCEWSFWLDPLDVSLPNGPFVCPSCAGKTPQKATDSK